MATSTTRGTKRSSAVRAGATRGRGWAQRKRAKVCGHQRLRAQGARRATSWRSTTCRATTTCRARIRSATSPPTSPFSPCWRGIGGGVTAAHLETARATPTGSQQQQQQQQQERQQQQQHPGAVKRERSAAEEGESRGPASRRLRTSGGEPPSGARKRPGAEGPRGTKRAADDERQGLGRKRARQGDGEEERRQLAESQGDQANNDQRRRHGRRYAGLLADPVDAADASGHMLRISGPLIWCSRCGRYAMNRLRRSLRSVCIGEATGAYATRLTRLWSGRHPLTNAALV